MSFSERQGLKPIRQVLQTDSIDTELRNRLWNVLSDSFPDFDGRFKFNYRENANFLSYCRKLWHEYFKQRKDSIPEWPTQAVDHIRQYFFSCQWYEAYDLIEFVVARTSSFLSPSMHMFNEILASELSAYRFVDGKLAPISSELEKQSIETAIARTGGRYSTASEHLQQAVTLLARKPAPDYRNSIKESISAVEAVCAIITRNPNATLGQALKVIDAEAPLHGALRSAFEKLYGYTSDADGIRHALMEEAKIEQEDAIFMLVTCSAFVSYAIAKQARHSST